MLVYAFRAVLCSCARAPAADTVDGRRWVIWRRWLRGS